MDQPENDHGDADVSTDGTLVVAHNLGASGNPSATVNGVTFTPFATSTTSNTIGNVTLSSSSAILGDNSSFGDIVGPFVGLSPDYQTLLRSGQLHHRSLSAADDLNDAGWADAGAQYQFQWWANEAATSSFARRRPTLPPRRPQEIA